MDPRLEPRRMNGKPRNGRRYPPRPRPFVYSLVQSQPRGRARHGSPGRRVLAPAGFELIFRYSSFDACTSPAFAALRYLPTVLRSEMTLGLFPLALSASVAAFHAWTIARCAACRFGKFAPNVTWGGADGAT